ncbi:MAG TPA: HAD family hydrolase [Acidobacteriaceae bacterium]
MLNLLIDADDTLWENNVYFEQAIASFLSLLDHTPHAPEQLRDHLNRIESETVREHGYGTGSFERSLLRCYEELTHQPLGERERLRIRGFAQSIVEAEIQLLPGVREALPRLAERHRLLLVTKGNHAEQADKLSRSGLAPHFTAVEILREKDAATYRELAHRRQLATASTWMIGNSPRSDINPALEAGFHAAYLRYHSTWVLEEEAIRTPLPGQRLLVCDDFASAAEQLLL